jgi:NAD+ synthase
MQHKKVVEHIVSWLDSYCTKAGLNGFVVGISGGIDSAVTSTLCARTGKPVTVLSMPIYQAEAQLTLAHQHSDWLCKSFARVEKREVELTPVFQAMEEHFPKDIQDPLTMANTRARLRMLTLYAHAANQKRLVAGTGNKVEDFGVGFYTKYGDGGVDLSPIADLMKTEVYAIAAELGIIQGIQDAAPTDGLWSDNRTDESQLGASYAELEWAMLFEETRGDDSTVSTRQKEVLETYRGFHRANKHKMDAIPVCVIPAELR